MVVPNINIFKMDEIDWQDGLTGGAWLGGNLATQGRLPDSWMELNMVSTTGSWCLAIWAMGARVLLQVWAEGPHD